jgi:glycosyltransferase involved in cell wall biosynthesis
VLWAFLPTAVDLAEPLGARLAVYHCVDHYAANPGVDPAWVDALERRMLARADLVFASSPVLAERLRGLGRSDVRLVPNVADVALFARALEPLPEPRELQGLPRPRAVYVGNLAGYRIDFACLGAVAEAGLSLVLVGPSGLGDVEALPPEARALLRRAGVRALGPRTQTELPAVLAHCDVALIPFRDNAHTRASLPLKLWEYVAAGLPVVATDLPNLRAAADEADVRVAADPAAFGARAREAASASAAGREEQSARARPHDWGARIEELCDAVARALDSGRASPRVQAIRTEASVHPPGTGSGSR